MRSPHFHLLRSKRGQRRGHAALFAIITLVVVLIIVLGIIAASNGVLMMGRREAGVSATRSLADAGVEYGYWQYAYNNAALPYTVSRSFGLGSFSVTVSDNSANLPNTIQIVSTGSRRGESSVVTRVFVVPAINYPIGFAIGAAKMQLNGTAAVSSALLRLTTSGNNQAGSAFYKTRVNVQSFRTHFNFQLTTPNADGITFTFQGNSATALGSIGGGLGYSYDGSHNGPVIARSVAIKFDLYNNQGEGINSTGMFLNGIPPTAPAVTLNGTGIDLHSGHVFQVSMSYNGAVLTVTITDSSTHATTTNLYTVNIPLIVGANTAYVGFTGGTGGSTATQDIRNWTYTQYAQ